LNMVVFLPLYITDICLLPLSVNLAQVFLDLFAPGPNFLLALRLIHDLRFWPCDELTPRDRKCEQAQKLA